MYQNVILEHLCINKLLKHKSLFMIKSTMKTKTFLQIETTVFKGFQNYKQNFESL